MKFKSIKINSLFLNLSLLGLIAFTLYFLIRFVGYGVDIKIHNFYLEEYLQNGNFPIPPGYYSLLYLIDLIIRIKYPFVVSSLLVLTAFIWWKFRIIYDWLIEKDLSYPINPKWLALALIFFGPLFLPQVDGDFWYFGKFTPTIWHNSTFIAALPFSLILFKRTIRSWEVTKKDFPWDILGLGLLILLIKPSFLFCYIPLFPLFTAVRFKWNSRQFGFSVLIAMILLTLLWIEKFLIYSWDPMVLEYYTKGDIPQIQIRPFKIWLHYAFEPAWDFFSSFALTLLFLIFWGKKAFSNLEFAFSFALLILALLIYFLFAESGFREWHANFYWQIPVALMIHQFLMVVFVLKEKKIESWKFDHKTGLFFLLFSLHVLCGVTYWLRIFTGRMIT